MDIHRSNPEHNNSPDNSSRRRRKTNQRAAIHAEIIAERISSPRPRTEIGRCFTCGYCFVQSARRFCSDRCRDYYDLTHQRYEPYNAVEYLRRFPPSAIILGQGSRGAIIQCRGCNERFESTGHKYCSSECRDKARNRQSIIASGIEFDDRRRKCVAPGCEGRIPLFRKGRAVSRAARFCSARCRNRAKSLEGIGEPKPAVASRYDKKVSDFIDPNSGTSASLGQRRRGQP